MQAPKNSPPNPRRKFTIGLACMLASFPLVFLPFYTRFLAVFIFFLGVFEYADGLIDNVKLKKAKKQTATA